MNIKLFLLLFIFFILISCQKEDQKNTLGNSTEVTSFETAFGGNKDDFANSLIIVDNIIYVYGTTKSKNDLDGDHYLLKLNLAGDFLSDFSFGSSAEEQGLKIINTSDKKLLLLGWTKNTATGKKDIHLIKTDLNGGQIWEQTYGGIEDDIAYDILELKNGEFLITGATNSYGKGFSDIYLIWIDQQGNELKWLTKGDVSQDGGSQSLELSNGDIMLFGNTGSYGATSKDYYLLKMNSNGDSLWSRRYGGSDYEETHSIVQTADGNFVLNGHSASTDPIHDMYGVKVDSNGNVLWEKNFGGAMHDGGMALILNSQGNYVFVARSMSFNNNQNIFIVITDEFGTQIKEQVIGQDKADMANEIIEYNGFYYLAGQTNSFSHGYLDVYLVKIPI